MAEQITSYKQTLDYMYSSLPMYQRIGASAYKKDLTNTLKLCAALGNPQDKIKTIHVAGTNGKGTVSHIIAFGLQMQGLKVGLYTSPHYKDFRERIKVNGNFISKAKVTSFVNKNKELIEEIKPSFFEITVAMAFDYFAKMKVDVAVIEVGLGGRLDSTNIITPLLSVVTNISFDHVEMLGNTLEAIAGEKAGIIKDYVPVLIGEKQKTINSVFVKKAKSCNSKVYYAESIVAIEQRKLKIDKRNLNVILPFHTLTCNTTLLAPYHDANIKTAFAALHLLQKEFIIDFKIIAKKFLEFSECVHYVGRWQIMEKQPLTILDSAHNEAGLKYTMQALSSINKNKLHFVLGFVNDKDLSKILKIFPIESHYYFAKANIPRGLDANQLTALAKSFYLNGTSFRSVKSAFKMAKKVAKKDEVIYVGGSIFVVAELL